MSSLKSFTSTWQGLDLGIREQRSGFFSRERLSVVKEPSDSLETQSPAKSGPAVTYKVNGSSFQARERWPPLTDWKDRDWKTTQEEEFRESLINGIPYGRPGRSVVLWAFIFPTVVSILVMISVSMSHTVFVLLSQTYFAGCVFFRIILRSVMSMIYCPLVFILLSQFYLLFSHCLTF